MRGGCHREEGKRNVLRELFFDQALGYLRHRLVLSIKRLEFARGQAKFYDSQGKPPVLLIWSILFHTLFVISATGCSRGGDTTYHGREGEGSDRRFRH